MIMSVLEKQEEIVVKLSIDQLPGDVIFGTVSLGFGV
jgi:hypothetical protein